MKQPKQTFLSVGGAAKRLGVSVRALQYYDKIGLISPSGQSEGGRRLYSDKDIVRLYQALSLKYLGFGLEEIKQKLFALESPADVSAALEAQEKQVAEQIEALTDVQKALGALRDEIKQINTVDWAKYAGIINLIRRRDENYWIVKYFETRTLSELSSKAGAQATMGGMEAMWDKAIALIDAGESPRGEAAMSLAKEWWETVTEITGGDMGVLQDIINFAGSAESWKNERWKQKMAKTQDFVGQASMAYFEAHGTDIIAGIDLSGFDKNNAEDTA